jgi:hypothetical protein
MGEDDEVLRGLREENERLKADVERFRTASEDALQQLDWCIGYLVGSNKTRVAQAIGANRSYIRSALLRRPELPTPEEHDGKERA